MELKIEYVPIDSIKPYKGNAKLHPDAQVEQIMNSIKEFGFQDPVGVWHDEIVEGHGRLMAAKKLGIDTVPVIRLDSLTDEQRRAYALVHNKLTMNSDFDVDILGEELDNILDIDMSMFDFGDIIEPEPEEVVEDDFTPVLSEDPKAKRGDIYQLGEHRLMCGDSTNIEEVKCLLGGGMVDLYLTDPPYNVSYVGKTADAMTIQNDSMNDGDFADFLIKAFNAANEVMKNGAAFYIWHADSEGYNFRKACKEAGWTLRETLIWNKNSLVLGRQDYQWKHEPCLYGWKEGTHNWYGDRKQTTVIDMDRPTASRLHPTMKPIELFAYLIQNSTQKGDAVFDSFGGSGTSIMACEELKRKCYTMELDPRYVDVIIDRWETFTGQKAVLLNGENQE